MKTIETLIEFGASIHLQDVYERNPLYYAARWGPMEVLKLLLAVIALFQS